MVKWTKVIRIKFAFIKCGKCATHETALVTKKTKNKTKQKKAFLFFFHLITIEHSSVVNQKRPRPQVWTLCDQINPFTFKRKLIKAFASTRGFYIPNSNLTDSHTQQNQNNNDLESKLWNDFYSHQTGEPSTIPLCKAPVFVEFLQLIRT